MGDQEAGAALQQAEGGLLEPLLRGSIHTAGGLVQDEDRRPAHQGPGHGQKLVLPLAEFPGRPRHEGLVPLGQALDETCIVRANRFQTNNMKEFLDEVNHNA